MFPLKFLPLLICYIFLSRVRNFLQKQTAEPQEELISLRPKDVYTFIYHRCTKDQSTFCHIENLPQKFPKFIYNLKDYKNVLNNNKHCQNCLVSQQRLLKRYLFVSQYHVFQSYAISFISGSNLVSHDYLHNLKSKVIIHQNCHQE